MEIESQFTPQRQETQESKIVVPKIELYDCDGVITNPAEKTVNQQLIQELAKRIDSGIIVGFNTGRSLDWAFEHIILPITQKIANPENLRNIYAAAEKGASWGKFTNGRWHEYLDPTITIPEPLKDDVRAAVNKYHVEHNTTVVYELPDKKTMLTFEMNDGMPIEVFRSHQPALAGGIQTAIQLADARFRVDSTEIAIDIESLAVGKHLGAKRILEELENDGVDYSQTHFKTFGDTPSDLRMAHEIHQRGLSVEFVFVGDTKTFNALETEYPIIFTGDIYDKGTLAHLSTLKDKKDN